MKIGHDNKQSSKNDLHLYMHFWIPESFAYFDWMLSILLFLFSYRKIIKSAMKFIAYSQFQNSTSAHPFQNFP